MNHIIVFFLAIIFHPGVIDPAPHAISSDDVEGDYRTPDGEGMIRFFKKDGLYHGMLVSGSRDQDLDIKNPDPALRSRKLRGIYLFTDFTFDAESKEWKDGTVYNPEDGKTYSCEIWFEDGDLSVLHARGYIGLPILGVTKKFTRMK